jgi:DNA polymerase-3 subunit alpha
VPALAERAKGRAARVRRDAAIGYQSLFAAPDDEPAAAPELPAADPWPPSERLRREKEALDLYLSAHPLAEHEAAVAAFADRTVAELLAAPGGGVAVVGGVVTGLERKHYKPKPGRPAAAPTLWASFRLEDLSGSVECVMWADAHAQFGDALAEDAVVFAVGEVRREADRTSLVVGRAVPLARGAKDLARGLALGVQLAPGEDTGRHADLPAKLSLALARFRGPAGGRTVPTFLVVRDAAGRAVEMKLGGPWAVCPQAVELAELEDLLGPGGAWFMGSRRPPAAAPAAPETEGEHGTAG